MRIDLHRVLCGVTAALLLTPPAGAVIIRAYDDADHDRFTGFPLVEVPDGSPPPVINGNSIFDGDEVHGIGWRADDTRWQFTLITRSHVLFATHALPPVGKKIRFLNESGQIVSRLITSRTAIAEDDGDPETPDVSSDLALITLDAPIDADEGVAPIPYLDLPLATIEEGDDELLRYTTYGNTDLVTFGKYARAGKGVISGLSRFSGSGLNPSAGLVFDYDNTGGDDDDAKLEVGDSGSPSIHYSGGVASVVGIHAAINTVGNIQSNVDSLVPFYAEEIDAHVGPQGYRITPLNAPTTSLVVTSTATTPTPRKGNPFSLEVMIQNTGGAPAGNLELAFDFNPGEEPDSISGSEWVSYGASSSPTLRKGLLEDGDSTTLTLSWDSAPLVNELTFELTSRSDKSPDVTSNPSQSLDPSFAEWAEGLAEGGTTDNPDGDELPNVSEYAYGSDAEDAQNLLPNGEPARPQIMSVAGDILLIYPERTDAALRGLSYIPQWSSDLDPLSWSTTPPPSLQSSSAAYDPAVPGFVKRTLSWSVDDPQSFVRLGVSLDE